ncbi:MAG: hypothetical protein GXO16_09110 [Epsilonproteobacteria bacterium]|nr:hypothetical protein [Campylobacterota bacterium]
MERLTPDAIVTINGADTKKHLNSIVLVDKEDKEVDEVTLTFDNDYPRPSYNDIASYNDIVLVYLGYKETGLYFCGSFKVQTTDKTDKHLKVKATSTDFMASMKVRRNLSYEKLTLADLVGIVAGRNGLAAKTDFGDVYFEHFAQTDESDLHLLNRLAYDYNAIYNIKNGVLVFLKKQNLPTFFVERKRCKSYTIKYANRTLYKSVKAVWWDTKENKSQEVVVGAGEPQYRLESKFKSKEEAKRRAAGMLSRLNSGIVKGKVVINGKNIVAGGKLVLSGFGGDDGLYTIKKVTHTMNNSGYEIKVEFER